MIGDVGSYCFYLFLLSIMFNRAIIGYQATRQRLDMGSEKPESLPSRDSLGERA